MRQKDFVGTINSQLLQLPEQAVVSLHFIKFLCKNKDTTLQNNITTKTEYKAPTGDL